MSKIIDFENNFCKIVELKRDIEMQTGIRQDPIYLLKKMGLYEDYLYYKQYQDRLKKLKRILK